jgi:UDP-2-acetamido-2,6-beta-L-arabino-hexul-4-ose reductase
MKTILITGSQGFVGKSLKVALQRLPEDNAVKILEFTSKDPLESLAGLVDQADVVFHLAGANRPQNVEDFQTVNCGLTQSLAECAEKSSSPPAIVFTSSTQATRDNDYGRSKLGAETLLGEYQTQTGNPVAIYRLPNVFGKGSRPKYNTVVATFCHNIARKQDIQVNDPSVELTFVYIDEVVRCLMNHLDAPATKEIFHDVEETFEVTLGELADKIQTIGKVRQTLKIPDLSDTFTKYLYSTYLSFLPEDEFGYDVELRTDDRGWLFEWIKSDSLGQIFVSTTKPGITRGNHYHDTKVEKFCLIQGQGCIRFRMLDSDQVIEYPVDDKTIRVLDIPPGYTHSIENTGDQNMIVLFWANEIFNPQRPDTYWVPVIE